LIGSLDFDLGDLDLGRPGHAYMREEVFEIWPRQHQKFSGNIDMKHTLAVPRDETSSGIIFLAGLVPGLVPEIRSHDASVEVYDGEQSHCRSHG
jgi:hypothetical protein